ncbi:MAG TPA: hypothetical protein VGF32_31260 [Streptosporangiaceae bacterium]
MVEQQQLGLGVDPAALRRGGQPTEADFDGVESGIPRARIVDPRTRWLRPRDPDAFSTTAYGASVPVAARVSCASIYAPTSTAVGTQMNA